MSREGLTALITGGSRGIGLHTARLLLQRGVRVYINGTDRDRCRTVARELDTAGLQALPLPFDVSDESAAEAACAELGGSVDILINNAGIFPDPATPAHEVDESVIRRAWEVNFLASWRLSSLFMPAMIYQGQGRIVNLTSGYGSVNKPGKNLLAYRSAKAALNVLTTTLAAEVAEHPGIHVSAVDPGWVRTDMGGDKAPRSVEDAAADVAWAALDNEGESGLLYRYQAVVDW